MRAVIFRYLRTSGTVAETRSGLRAVMNTSAVRSSASGWLPTFEYISRYTQVTLSRYTASQSGYAAPVTGRSPPSGRDLGV